MLKVKSKALDYLIEKEAELIKEIEKTKLEQDEIRKELKISLSAINLCLDTIEKISNNRKVIEVALTDLVQFVLGGEYSFEFIEKRKDGEVKGLQPVLRKGDILLENIGEDCGAGAFAIIDFVFRLLAITTHGGTERIIIADEPLPEVDNERWKRFGEWLSEFCEKMNFQVIMTTHAESQFGKTYRVVIKEGISEVYLDD